MPLRLPFFSCPLAIALLATPIAGARAASVTIQVNANVVKPLTLSVKQDLDFGQILLSGTPGTKTVSISQTGVLTCAAGLTCTGAVRPAIFNTSGTKSQPVRIYASASNLVDAASGATILFTPIAPTSVTLTNSGFPGTDFRVGGSISIPSTVPEGLYSGNVEVTVDYQ